MRITNVMMSNSMLNRINKNMTTLNTYYTQMSSGKKIQMPSEDPITASRALKLRNIVSSTGQYTANANQAGSWMETTESAFTNMTSILTSMSELCVQGASDQYKEDDRQKILNQFNSYVAQFESELNSTYMGRYMFSGYMTDKPAILKDEKTGKNILNSELYDKYINIDKIHEGIQEVLDKANGLLDQIADLNGQIDLDDRNDPNIAERDKLIEEFQDLVKAKGFDLFVYPDGSLSFITSDPGNDSANNPDDPVTDIPGSGNIGGGSGTLILEVPLVEGNQVINKIDSIINDENPKDVEFVVGGINVDIDIPDEVYEDATIQNRIKIEVGVNNYIDINSFAPEVYTPEMYETLHSFDRIFDYMSGDLSQEDIDTYFGGKSYEELSPAEVVSFDSSLRSKFEEMISTVNSYNSSVTEQHTNLGVRMNRLSLIQERLGDDNVNYTSLLSKNEDINYAEAAMNFNVANASYQASLKVGMTINQLTLADYI